MNLLVIGGTRFVGRHIVERGRQQGHTVTLFNRGTNDVFPDLKHIKGDRNSSEALEQLSKHNWDAVIDTCAYFPRQVEMLTKVIPATVPYVFISTVSVYKSPAKAYQDEKAKLIRIASDTKEELVGETYGGFKVLCEELAQNAFKNTLIARPGIIVGPYDETDRFTYWISRIAKGGTVIASNSPEQAVQFIDARDLARWIISHVESKTMGIYNLVNTPNQLNFGTLLRKAKEISQSNADIIEVSATFIEEQAINTWQAFPFYLPADYINFMLLSNAKAKTAGLTLRPIEETIVDVLEWSNTLADTYEYSAGLTLEQEKAILEKWLTK